MGLEKAILHKKEHRKMYRGSKRFDALCKNHGACVWCRLGRLHKRRKEEASMRDKENEE